MSRRTRAGLGAATAALLVLSLAGCGAPEENRYATEPPAPVTAEPALGSEQVGRILKSVDGALADGWGRADVAGFGARADGPYVQLASHTIKLAKKRKQKVADQPVERSLVVVPVQTGWPRFFLTVGTRAGSEVPLVQVFRSSSARDPYALWAELSLLPGVQWPQTSRDPSAVVALDPAASANELELALSPADAVRAYATLLTKGTKVKAARAFARDDFAVQVRTRVAEEAEALTEVAKVTSVHRAAKDGVLALRLADGSALVIGQLVQKHVITVKKGSGTVTVRNPDIVALTGRKSITKVLTRQALEVVAIRVPAPGAGKVTVVAAGKGDLKVSGR